MGSPTKRAAVDMDATKCGQREAWPPSPHACMQPRWPTCRRSYWAQALCMYLRGARRAMRVGAVRSGVKLCPRRYWCEVRQLSHADREFRRWGSPLRFRVGKWGIVVIMEQFENYIGDNSISTADDLRALAEFTNDLALVPEGGREGRIAGLDSRQRKAAEGAGGV
ncbi:hypothetical protein NL676_013571 [Syzygium grande]|nr:hypothetical protein NL676_013571 [Syzygium grande]